MEVGARHNGFCDSLSKDIARAGRGVIVDQLTKLTHVLAVRMTFTLEEFCRLYIREIVRLHGVPISIVSNRDPRFIAFLGDLLTRHGDTIDDKPRFLSPDRRSVKEDHPNVGEHVTSMRPGS